jgi:hypothetical protein
MFAELVAARDPAGQYRLDERGVQSSRRNSDTMTARVTVI